MQTKRVATENAPAAIGPYSQAVVAGDFLFVSGQIALDPETGSLIQGDVIQQLPVVLKNIKAILEAGGSAWQKIVKVTIYVRDIANFGAINEEYSKHFDEPYPAREVVEVSGLPKNAELEISVIAFV